MKWSDIDWAATEAAVRRIQDRIFRAAKAGDGARVKNLQKLLVRSRSAKLLAIRQVTQQNAGRNTPGIDGVVCRTPEDRVALLESGLDLKGYKPQPVRRIYIPKANGKMRPLGIQQRVCRLHPPPRLILDLWAGRVPQDVNDKSGRTGLRQSIRPCCEAGVPGHHGCPRVRVLLTVQAS